MNIMVMVLCGRPYRALLFKNYLGINIDHNVPHITDIQDISGYVKSLWNMIEEQIDQMKKKLCI